MGQLEQILRQTVRGYSGQALNGYSYMTVNDEHHIYTVLSIAKFHEKRIVDTGLIARLVNDKIVIEHDANDKPLVDALVQAGVDRSQIILVYAGDTLDEPEAST